MEFANLKQKGYSIKYFVPNAVSASRHNLALLDRLVLLQVLTGT